MIGFTFIDMLNTDVLELVTKAKANYEQYYRLKHTQYITKVWEKKLNSWWRSWLDPNSSFETVKDELEHSMDWAYWYSKPCYTDRPWTLFLDLEKACDSSQWIHLCLEDHTTLLHWAKET